MTHAARASRTGVASGAMTKLVNRLLAPFGLKTIRRKKLARLAQAAQYEFYWHKAQKRIDIRELDGFGPLAARAVAAHRTGMREDRLYTLWQAVAALPPGDHAIAEVGAFKGGSARFLGEALAWFNRSNPLYVCDTFQGHAVVDADLDGPHRVGEQFTNTSYEDVSSYLADLPTVRIVQGDFRLTSRQIECAAPFALAHVDVDVYPVTGHCLEFFAERLLPGGLVVVDDYGFTTCRGARQAVDEFARAHPDFRVFHLLTGQALVMRHG
jgi:O-methyltransferase